MKLLNKIKKLVAAGAALAIIGFSAFAMSNNDKEAIQEQYWFEMNAAGTTPVPGPVDPADLPCEQQLTTPNCARLYNASQTTGTGSSRAVITSQINNHVSFRTREN
ncbi:hypothetical protein [Sphingobacterium deserti]|uniref:Uncharacterized protein n=1 Tax=Sphingobacterium deserti TaxID=1229276 RepID=A0A0B8T5A0_9SPHI|nr:hypothetical protein [Sphingobacterium deserti]KGE12679.1 hypothetical protein DI53_3719 [Sphingobacterium deserti]